MNGHDKLDDCFPLTSVARSAEALYPLAAAANPPTIRLGATLPTLPPSADGVSGATLRLTRLGQYHSPRGLGSKHGNAVCGALNSAYMRMIISKKRLISGTRIFYSTTDSAFGQDSLQNTKTKQSRASPNTYPESSFRTEACTGSSAREGIPRIACGQSLHLDSG